MTEWNPADQFSRQVEEGLAEHNAEKKAAAPRYHNALRPAEWNRPTPPTPGLVYIRDKEPKAPEDEGGVYLPQGVVGIIAGEGGTGKTTLMAQLALAVVSGGEWLRSWHPSIKDGQRGHKCCQGGVLYFAAEDSLTNIRRRLKAAARLAYPHVDKLASRGAEPGRLSDLRIVTPEMVGERTALIDYESSNPYRVSALVGALASLAPEDCRLIVLDPLVRMLPPEADENNNMDARDCIKAIEVLAKEASKRSRYEVTVLAVHHASKASRQGSNAIRGASAFRDNARWAAVLSREYKTEKRAAEFTKREVDSKLLSLAVIKTNESLTWEDTLVMEKRVLRPFDKGHDAELVKKVNDARQAAKTQPATDNPWGDE